MGQMSSNWRSGHWLRLTYGHRTRPADPRNDNVHAREEREKTPGEGREPLRPTPGRYARGARVASTHGNGLGSGDLQAAEFECGVGERGLSQSRLVSGVGAVCGEGDVLRVVAGIGPQPT